MGYPDYTWAYAVVFGIAIFAVRILQLLQTIVSWVLELDRLPSLGTTPLCRYLRRFHIQHLTNQPVLGSWQRLDVVCLAGYLTINAVVVLYDTSNPAEAGVRAGTTSLINLIFLVAGPHLAFVADLLGLSLDLYKRLHRVVGLTCVLLALVHIAIFAAIKKIKVSQDPSSITFAVVSAVSIASQLLFLSSRMRRSFFELALRAHQGLAALFVYACWRHLPPGGLYPQVYLIVAIGVFVVSSTVQLAFVSISNRLGLPRCDLSFEHGIVRVHLRLRKPIRIDAGQYINLWIPVRASAWAQTHPFTVISWSPEPQKELELIVQPRRGLSRLLSQLPQAGSSDYTCVFSGPHGRRLPLHTYHDVIMIATGIGMAAVAPFLTKLIHCAYEDPASRLRSIHIAWELDGEGSSHIPDFDASRLAYNTADIKAVFQSLIEAAIKKDTGFKLRLSFYNSSQPRAHGEHGLVNDYDGHIPLEQVLPPEAAPEAEKTIIAVSASSTIRNATTRILRERGLESVALKHLSYQP
ncbi:hypothetical protein F5Y16DRAFT_420926 [Xylariaceae sp. FL0255]|nr:hypothetical protein F5Y16DRAFT_420926 [Xylariaceae sp. FL0255]